MKTWRDWQKSGKEFAEFVLIGDFVDDEMVNNMKELGNETEAISKNAVAYAVVSGIIDTKEPLCAYFRRGHANQWKLLGYCPKNSPRNVFQNSEEVVPIGEGNDMLRASGFDVGGEETKTEANSSSGDLQALNLW